MVIATTKAALVVLLFMHMTEAPGANRLVFSVSIVFMLVMMTGVFGDLLTRNPMTLPGGCCCAGGSSVGCEKSLARQEISMHAVLTMRQLLEYWEKDQKVARDKIEETRTFLAQS